MVGTTRRGTINQLTAGGHHAKIECDEDLDLFRGEMPGLGTGLGGGADFSGQNPKQLRIEFSKSLEVFLQVCKVKGLEPRRHFSGQFNLRISPEPHERLAIEAQAQSKRISTLAQEARQERGCSSERRPTLHWGSPGGQRFCFLNARPHSFRRPRLRRSAQVKRLAIQPALPRRWPVETLSVLSYRSTARRTWPEPHGCHEPGR